MLKIGSERPKLTGSDINRTNLHSHDSCYCSAKIEAVMRQSKRVVHLRVKELAEVRHLSDLELAHLSGVDVRVIRHMWEGQDAGRVLLHQLMRAADALEVDVCELLQSKDADSTP